MSDYGLYALTKIMAGGLSAIMTGPLGAIDLADTDLSSAISGGGIGYTAAIEDRAGRPMGYIGQSGGRSPRIRDLPDTFIQALISVEDTRFGEHPGVDPVAVVSAAVDSLRGNTRGGSTLTQQLVKNAITGSDQTLDRKAREAILAIRVAAAYPSDRILQGYLSNVWFGRGQHGASGAALAWFGKPWSDISLPEAAFLAGILKGPAYYDPMKYPERAKARRDTVLDMMLDRGMISDEEHRAAKITELVVISEEDRPQTEEGLSLWAEKAVLRGMDEEHLTESSLLAGRDVSIVTTLDAAWQDIAQAALDAGIARIGKAGPAGNVSLDGWDSSPSRLAALRSKAANMLSTSRTTGRAIILSQDKDTFDVLIDRGYGEVARETIEVDLEDLGFTPAPGDVLPYHRSDAGHPILEAAPQAQGAVVIIDNRTGAILASSGGVQPELYPFDRSQAERQPGSAIKPFLWTAAMERGIRATDLVEDIEQDYRLSDGTIWRPRNYDKSQAGLIPLFVGLEESSNLAAASLVSRIGLDPLAAVTETAGVYPYDGMKMHAASALGASETTLTRLTSGYSALAAGGIVQPPYVIAKITSSDETIWTQPVPEIPFALATSASISDISSMLYGVTKRGTAYSAFKSFPMPVAGKTGTTQDYRDAWFLSYTPAVSVGVWVGRDDFTSIPGYLSGSRAAAPIGRDVYRAALEAGLLEESGFFPGQIKTVQWPPALLTYTPPARSTGAPQVTEGPRPKQAQTSSADWVDPQEKEGYLDMKKEDDIFPKSSPKSEKSGLIFKTPW